MRKRLPGPSVLCCCATTAHTHTLWLPLVTALLEKGSIWTGTVCSVSPMTTALSQRQTRASEPRSFRRKAKRPPGMLSLDEFCACWRLVFFRPSVVRSLRCARCVVAFGHDGVHPTARRYPPPSIRVWCGIYGNREREEFYIANVKE